MESSLYVGTISHRRRIPRDHHFRYPFFMWFLNLEEVDQLPSLGRWFSTSKMALSRFYRPDYYGDPSMTLSQAIKERMLELTGRKVEGQVFGLMNLRTLGLYFSPVNFYYGYDTDGQLTHFLAEVSNIPWNERHQYSHYVKGEQLTPDHPKQFHVSPFNPLTQHYQWQLSAPNEKVFVKLDVSDDRGHVFTAQLDLERRKLDTKSVSRELLRKPVMTAFIVAGIYWQALKLYLKGVPYIPYKKEVV